MNNFNSIKVRLEHILDAGTSSFFDNFNSIKVRLEQGEVIKAVTFQEFQFHKGTIRTMNIISRKKSSLKFQFHKGTIRTKRSSPVSLLLFYFNSIKVRLEQYKKGVGYVGNQFQFHKGTIRTRWIRNKWFASAYFNSIKVRLERSVLMLQKLII